MKCSMDEEGKITIEPSDHIEAYALKSWIGNNESGKIKVVTECEKEPTMGFRKREEK